MKEVGLVSDVEGGRGKGGAPGLEEGLWLKSHVKSRRRWPAAWAGRASGASESAAPGRSRSCGPDGSGRK